MKLSLPFGLLVALLATAAPASELRVPQDYQTIQAAIDASANGDVVLVAPGVHREALDLRGRRITLRSAAGPAVTFLDGAGLEKSILTARSGETRNGTRVEGFTFRHGFGTTTPACNLGGRKGGALFVLGAGISIAGSVFEENGETDKVRGGAIFGCSADIVVTTSRFERNHASHGGAIAYVGLSTRRLTLDDSTFHENDGSGGAISADLFQNSSMTIAGTTFEANDGVGAGGAVEVNAFGAATVTIDRSFFTANRASHGGALYGYFASSAKGTVTDSQFTGGVAAFGGGILVHAAEDSVVDISGCDFRDHEAAHGGGLFATAAGAPVVDPGGRIRIDACRFFDNVAHACCNAGIILDMCTLDGPAPRGNDLNFGGGADLRTITGGMITLANSLFAGNSAPRGGGVHAGSCVGGTIDIVNCTIVDNAGGLHLRLGAPKMSGATDVGSIRVANSIVRGNGGSEIVIEDDFGPSTAAVTFSDVEGGIDGAGNFDLPPSFVNPAARDYRLASGSACIDSGDNAALHATITEDLAGRPRLADDPNTRDRSTSPQVDLGAYEFQPEKPPRRRVAAPR